MKVSYWTIFVLIATHHTAGSSSVTWSPYCPPSWDFVFISDPIDPCKFYYCQSGDAHPILCPQGSQWNQTLGRCDFNSLCSSSQPESGQASVELQRNPFCPMEAVQSGPFYFFPDESNHRRIVKCLNGYAYVVNCPSGQVWNVERNRCVAENEEDRNTERVVSLKNVIHPNCSALDELGSLGLARFLKKSESLYICRLDKSYIVLGIHLNEVQTIKGSNVDSALILASKIAVKKTTLSRTSAPETAPPTVATTVHPNLPIALAQCSDPKSIARVGIPGECHSYLQCHQGRAYRINCRSGREWSDVAKDCIEASLAGCSVNSFGLDTTTTVRTTVISTTSSSSPPSSPTTSSSPPSTTQQRPIGAPATCTSANQFLPHPNDCRKYIQCDNGNAITRDCPHPLFWNKNTFICDWNCE